MGYKDKSSKNSQEDLNELEKANDRLKIENKRLNFQIEENTKNQLKNFIKFTSQSIVLYNHQGEITFVNQNFSDLFGYPTDALIGSQLSELFSSESQPIIFQGIMDDFSVPRKVTVLRADGIPLSTTIFGIKYSFSGQNSIGLLISKNEQRTELQSLQDQFLQVVSHELRTPTTIIKGYVDYLRKYEDLPSEKVTYAYDRIKMNINRLNELIERVSKVKSIKSNIFTINREWIYCESLISEIRELIDVLYPTRTIILSSSFSDPHSMLYLDLSNIRQAINHLLSNANKNSPCHTNIVLTVITEDGKLIVSIEDFGTGIDSRILEKLNHPFAHQTTEYSATGLGIGLFISNRIIQAHGGLLEVIAKDKVGTKVTFRIPISQQDSDELSPKHSVLEFKAIVDKMFSEASKDRPSNKT